MSIEEYADLLGDTVTIEQKTGQDGYNVPTYGAPLEVSAHLFNKISVVMTGQGKEVVSQRRLILDRVIEAFHPDDRVTLTTGSAPLVLTVKGHELVSDENGPHHSVLLV